MKKLNIPQSSNILEMSYDAESKLLEVTFKGGTVYDYYDVPSEIAEKFEHCESAGKTFTENIKRKTYKWTKKEK